MEHDEEDLRDVMEQDKRRGRTRRPVDVEEKRKRERLQADLARAIRVGDEVECLRLLRDVAGLQDGTPEYEQACAALRRALRSRPSGGGGH